MAREDVRNVRRLGFVYAGILMGEGEGEAASQTQLPT